MFYFIFVKSKMNEAIKNYVFVLHSQHILHK